jgi:DNA uptake protein ComE-like DNA-binding protein
MINKDESLEQYSQDSTVRLFKTVVSKGGNIHYPGIYSKANPLPEKFMTAQYVELISGSTIAGVEKESDVVGTISPEDALAIINKGQVLTEHKPSPGLIEEVSLHKNASKVEEFEIKTQSSFEPKSAQLNINTATRSQIVALQGVGSKTADKVIELRELFPFADSKDLNDRVQLTFGRDWNEFNLVFD